MKKLFVLVMIFALMFSSCVYESGETKQETTSAEMTDEMTSEQTTLTVSETTTPPSEFPNEPEDGYSKRY